jgi:hypothetical protein
MIASGPGCFTKLAIVSLASIYAFRILHGAQTRAIGVSTRPA